MTQRVDVHGQALHEALLAPGCDTLAVAAALGAEPMPASLENRPRLMPSMTTDPANPPKMDWKSKAEAKMRPNTAGISPRLVNGGPHAPGRCRRSAMTGTMMDVMTLMRLRAAEDDECRHHRQHDAARRWRCRWWRSRGCSIRAPSVMLKACSPLKPKAKHRMSSTANTTPSQRLPSACWM